jgi:hypothetical protein
MLKSRFIPYIVGGCIVAFLSVSYVGYRTYQNHVEFKAFVSNAHPFNRSIEGGHVHSSNDHTHGGEGLPVPLNSNQTGEAGQAGSGHEHGHHLTPSGEYVYEINGIPLYSDTPMSQEEIAVMEWVETGKMTPAVEEQFRFTEMMREQDRLNVIQRVVTPDGKLHQVIVPRDEQYAEGDAILRSELDPPRLGEAARYQKSWWARNKLIIEGVDYYPPEEYYSIADPYEREEYFNKFTWAIGYGISMAEVEKKVAQGELDFSLSEDARKHVDQSLAMVERSEMLALGAPPPLSDKPPVKVSFLPDEGVFALPGWIRKEESQSLNVGRSILADGVEASGAIFDEGSLNGDASGASVRSDNPLSPSDLSGVVEPTFTHRSKPGIETSNKTVTPPTAENVETQLREQLSPERFDKAQQLFDKAQQLIGRYGSEEGLRRFREMHPEAAAQFERKRRNTRRVAR